MSRSRRKTPIAGLTRATSEKYEKRLYNRRYRRVFKQHIACNHSNEPWPHLLDYSNLWGMAKDGKKPFDPDEYPELMQK